MDSPREKSGFKNNHGVRVKFQLFLIPFCALNYAVCQSHVVCVFLLLHKLQYCSEHSVRFTIGAHASAWHQSTSNAISKSTTAFIFRFSIPGVAFVQSTCWTHFWPQSINLQQLSKSVIRQMFGKPHANVSLTTRSTWSRAPADTWLSFHSSFDLLQCWLKIKCLRATRKKLYTKDGFFNWRQSENPLPYSRKEKSQRKPICLQFRSWEHVVRVSSGQI